MIFRTAKMSPGTAMMHDGDKAGQDVTDPAARDPVAPGRTPNHSIAGGLVEDLVHDLSEVRRRYGKSHLMTILAGRGFHALVFYRIAHRLNRLHVPLLPLVLTRTIQILYGIEIDPRASLEGGITIIHGIGLVIGYGVSVRRGALLYHGVTLGMKSGGHHDGFPRLGLDCTVGAGAKLLGDIDIGDHSIIGPNVVLMQSVPAGSIVKVPEPVIRLRSGYPNLETNQPVGEAPLGGSRT